jgi:hypothetical protein
LLLAWEPDLLLLSTLMLPCVHLLLILVCPVLQLLALLVTWTQHVGQHAPVAAPTAAH